VPSWVYWLDGPPDRNGVGRAAPVHTVAHQEQKLA
jgi:hypothetical protein